MPPKAKAAAAAKISRVAAKKAPTKAAAAKAKAPAAKKAPAKRPSLIGQMNLAALSGTIRHTFEGVNEMDAKGEHSATVNIGGYPWRLWMGRYGGGDHQLFIECLQSESTPIWHCDLNYSLTLEDQTYGAHFVEQKSATVTFDQNMVRSEQLDRFMQKNCDEHGELHYAEVVCHISVKEGRKDRFRRKLSMDFFTADEEKFDCELSVGGKKIHVNKQFLASHSSFFNDLFYAAGKKGDEKTFKLAASVKPEGLIDLLNYLYRVDDEITIDNYENMAGMAKQFVVQDLKDAVECFMAKSFMIDAWSDEKKLATAETMQMHLFMEATLDDLYAEYKIEEVMKSSEFKEYSGELKKRVQMRLDEMKKAKK